MRQPLQLARVFLVVAALLLPFPLGPGRARAAIPSGGTISSAHLTTTWQGQYYERGQTVDPALCPEQLLDPENVICDHFRLNVSNAGTAQVTITWPSPNCATNPTKPPLLP